AAHKAANLGVSPDASAETALVVDADPESEIVTAGCHVFCPVLTRSQKNGHESLVVFGACRDPDVELPPNWSRSADTDVWVEAGLSGTNEETIMNPPGVTPSPAAPEIAGVYW